MTDQEIDPGARKVALGLLFCAFALSITDRMILSVLFDPIKAEFGLSDTQLGLLGGFTFALFYATLGVPLAKYADRNDRRRLIAACLILFSAMTALSGLATGFLMLVVLRIFVGVGEAGVTPASQSIIADYYPLHKRSSAMSILAAGANFGMILGFLLGGIISHYYGWRAAMFVIGVPGTLLGVAIFFYLKEPMRGGADQFKKTSKVSEGSIFDSVRVIFASPVLRQILAASTISGMVTYGITQWLPAYLGRVHEFPQAQIGISMALLVGLVGGLGTLMGGRLTDSLSRRRVDLGVRMIALTQLSAVPLLILGYLSGSVYVSLGLLTFPIFLITFYLGPSLALIQTYAPVEMRSMAAAVNMFCLNLIGLSLGPLLVGFISDVLEPTQGNRGLAVALSCLSLFSIWSAIHFWLAGRAMLKLDLDDSE